MHSMLELVDWTPRERKELRRVLRHRDRQVLAGIRVAQTVSREKRIAAQRRRRERERGGNGR